jgi:hypothetical protein
MTDWIVSLFAPTYEPQFAFGGCDTELSWFFIDCWLL